MKQGHVSIGHHCGTEGTGVRHDNVPGHAGRAQLVMLATDCDTPGVAKRATFHFPDWDEGSETFDTLAMIAEIVQDACVEVEATRHRQGGRKPPHHERSAGDGHGMAEGVKEE